MTIERIISNPLSQVLDGAWARKLRNKARYKSQRSLAIKIRTTQQIIARFETGKAPKHYLVSEKNKKYMEWLKGQGYNLYNM